MLEFHVFQSQNLAKPLQHFQIPFDEVHKRHPRAVLRKRDAVHAESASDIYHFLPAHAVGIQRVIPPAMVVSVARLFSHFASSSSSGNASSSSVLRISQLVMGISPHFLRNVSYGFCQSTGLSYSTNLGSSPSALLTLLPMPTCSFIPSGIRQQPFILS